MIYYTVVSANSEQELIDKVSELLSKGASVSGGISVTAGPSGHYRYFQAMVTRRYDIFNCKSTLSVK